MEGGEVPDSDGLLDLEFESGLVWEASRDSLAPLVGVEGGEVGAVDADAAVCGQVEAGEEFDEGCFDDADGM